MRETLRSGRIIYLSKVAPSPVMVVRIDTSIEDFSFTLDLSTITRISPLLPNIYPSNAYFPAMDHVFLTMVGIYRPDLSCVESMGNSGI